MRIQFPIARWLGFVWFLLLTLGATAALLPPDRTLDSVAYGDGKFLAVGGVHGANLFLTSMEGLNWKELGTTGAVGGEEWASHRSYDLRWWRVRIGSRILPA